MEPQNIQPQNSPAQTQNIFTVPLAIVIAGAVIAGGIIVSKYIDSPAAPTAAVTSSTITVPAVTETDHILGKADAALTFVEYSDTECPFCKQFHSTMHQIMNEYGEKGSVAWVYRHLPLYKPNQNGQSLHSRAGKEAEATECANELGGKDGFWAFTDYIYATTTSNNSLDPARLPLIAKAVGLNVTAFNTCLSSGKYKAKVDKEYDEAFIAGAQGTPYVIILSKEKISEKTQNKVMQNVVAAFAKLSPGASIPPELIVFDADGSKVAFSGALPQPVIKIMIDTLLK